MPTRLPASAAKSTPSFGGGPSPESAIFLAPSSTRSKKRPTAAGMPFAVSTGCVTMLAAAMTGLAVAWPAAFRNAPDLVVFDSSAIAGISPTRTGRRSRPATRMSPKAEWIVKTSMNPLTGTFGSRVKFSPFRSWCCTSCEAWKTGSGSNPPAPCDQAGGASSHDATTITTITMCGRSLVTSLSSPSSIHRVAATRHAGAERTVVVGAALRQGVLLLRLVRLLLPLPLLHLLLLLLVLARSANQPEETADGGADRGPLSGIAADRATRRA